MKRLAVRTVSSTYGSQAFIARGVLGALNFGYGPRGSPGQRAVSCITVDFDVTDPSRFEDNRAGTMALIELAERYSIPLTWAVCGKSAAEDTRSYSAIVNSTAPHELGVHTYSHLDATASAAEDFRADVKRCIQSLGLESPRTFAFPWNREAHFDVLSELGFRVYRGKARALGTPVMREGLWNVRPVYYVDQKSKGAEALINGYLELCVKHSLPFHLWTHPWGLVIDGRPEPMIETLEAVFALMKVRREEGVIVTSTLGEIAASLDGTVAEGAPIAKAALRPLQGGAS